MRLHPAGQQRAAQPDDQGTDQDQAGPGGGVECHDGQAQQEAQAPQPPDAPARDARPGVRAMAIGGEPADGLTCRPARPANQRRGRCQRDHRGQEHAQGQGQAAACRADQQVRDEHQVGGDGERAVAGAQAAMPPGQDQRENRRARIPGGYQGPRPGVRAQADDRGGQQQAHRDVERVAVQRGAQRRGAAPPPGLVARRDGVRQAGDDREHQAPGHDAGHAEVPDQRGRRPLHHGAGRHHDQQRRCGDHGVPPEPPTQRATLTPPGLSSCLRPAGAAVPGASRCPGLPTPGRGPVSP